MCPLSRPRIRINGRANSSSTRRMPRETSREKRSGKRENSSTPCRGTSAGSTLPIGRRPSPGTPPRAIWSVFPPPTRRPWPRSSGGSFRTHRIRQKSFPSSGGPWEKTKGPPQGTPPSGGSSPTSTDPGSSWWANPGGPIPTAPMPPLPRPSVAGTSGSTSSPTEACSTPLKPAAGTWTARR